MIHFTSGPETAMSVGAQPDGEDGVPEHPQGAVQQRHAQAGVRDHSQDAVRGPSLPTRLLVQESARLWILYRLTCQIDIPFIDSLIYYKGMSHYIYRVPIQHVQNLSF